jgi:protein ImuB
MPPRVIGRADWLVARAPARQVNILRPVENRRAALDCAQLWVGVQVATNQSGSRPLLAANSALEQLAIRAQRFTPRVSLVPPDGLLLEVKGSLHLFNGTDGLLRALASDCNTLGIKPVLALAPTALAAIVAARSGKPFTVTDKAQLVGKLASLPLAPLRWPQDVLERLARMGVTTIGQALRLPRAGFARRFGADPLAELDRLTGKIADLRHRFQARERFRRRRELTCELENTGSILAALAPLLAALGKFLQARQCGVMQLECRLRHRHAPPSSCVLRLAAPLADVGRLTQLLGERLNALALPEPVRSCEIRTGRTVQRVLASNSLWQAGEYGGGANAESPELIERLRARLGPGAVYGLQVLSGHRPENAWSVKEPNVDRSSAPEAAPSPWAAFRRPLWLLVAPQRLDECEGLPQYGGPLRLSGDVERIETGWWDGADIGRDYYTAFDNHGVRLWIFRERAGMHRWFLHGVFG